MISRHMKYVFGPVPTRRLGRSLGIDTVPAKTCNWNCVYCQLGRSTPVVNDRREYVPTEDVLEEMARTLATLDGDGVDWITFVASGEGTLHSRLGELVQAAKQRTGHPVAVITNGSTLHLPDVREALAEADALLPSLDAGSADLFRTINRAHPSLSFQGQVAGLEAFAGMRRRGRLWVEVMLIAGLNDTEPALKRLAATLSRIDPDEVHITLPTRCPAESWVRGPDDECLQRAVSLLGERARLAPSAGVHVTLPPGTPIEEQILSVVTRHPMRRFELQRLLSTHPRDDVEQAVDRLLAAETVQAVHRFDDVFIVLGGLRFDDA
jgi:wyosine [tRNA(Phe)-imidazoG37] synthetase (radical SAM superfamily)